MPITEWVCEIGWKLLLVCEAVLLLLKHEFILSSLKDQPYPLQHTHIMYFLLILWLLVCLVAAAMAQNPGREKQGLNLIQSCKVFVFTGDTPMAGWFQMWHYSVKYRKQPA